MSLRDLAQHVFGKYFPRNSTRHSETYALLATLGPEGNSGRFRSVFVEGELRKWDIPYRINRITASEGETIEIYVAEDRLEEAKSRTQR